MCVRFFFSFLLTRFQQPNVIYDDDDDNKTARYTIMINFKYLIKFNIIYCFLEKTLSGFNTTTTTSLITPLIFLGKITPPPQHNIKKKEKFHFLCLTRELIVIIIMQFFYFRGMVPMAPTVTIFSLN